MTINSSRTAERFLCQLLSYSPWEDLYFGGLCLFPQSPQPYHGRIWVSEYSLVRSHDPELFGQFKELEIEYQEHDNDSQFHFTQFSAWP